MILNPIFQDGMVLAANKPIRVFGEGGDCHRALFIFCLDFDILYAIMIKRNSAICGAEKTK